MVKGHLIMGSLYHFMIAMKNSYNFLVNISIILHSRKSVNIYR
jgi:hypothetical protein